MARSTVTSKGQVTIPKVIRESLGIGPGAHLVFRVERGERLVAEVEREKAPSLAGALRHLAKERPVTVEEMNAAIRRRAALKSERTRADG
jgi:AbrB family looped-hinge helix DNA binding protein